MSFRIAGVRFTVAQHVETLTNSIFYSSLIVYINHTCKQDSVPGECVPPACWLCFVVSGGYPPAGHTHPPDIPTPTPLKRPGTRDTNRKDIGYPPPRQTDTCKNITFPQLRLLAVIIGKRYCLPSERSVNLLGLGTWKCMLPLLNCMTVTTFFNQKVIGKVTFYIEKS